MKNLLLTATMTLVGLSANAAFNQATFYAEQRLDRSGWSVSGCSEQNNSSGTDGGLDDIINGSNQMWHTGYGHGDQSSYPHFFIIDRGEGTLPSTDGCGFVSRQDQGPKNGESWRGNGHVISYAVYATDDISGISTTTSSTGNAETVTAAHDSMTSWMNTNTDKLLAEGDDMELTNEDYGERKIAFSAATTARYIIFVVRSAGCDNLTSAAICQDFYLYDSTITPLSNLDRSAWSVSASSTTAEGDQYGVASAIDGNYDTFWASSWYNACTEDNPHIFAISLGLSESDSPVAISGIKWRGRSDNATDHIKKLRVYVTNEEVSALSKAGFESLTPVYTNDEIPVAQTEDYSVQFDQPAEGKYVYVYVTQSHHSGSLNFSLAEINVLAAPEAAEAYNSVVYPKVFENSKQSALAAVAEWQKWFPREDHDQIVATISAMTYSSSDELDTKISALNAETRKYYSMAEGVVVTVKNVRRDGSQYGPWLCVNADNAVNTQTDIAENAKWILKKAGATPDGTFKLFNLGTARYISNSLGLTASSDDAKTLYLSANSLNEGAGSALRFSESNGINIDSDGNSIVEYAYTDPGSSWQIQKVENLTASAIQKSTADSRVYYRIRNNRLLDQACGSLMNLAAPSESTTIGSQNITTATDGPGTLWYFEEGASGGLIIRNLVGEYADQGVLGLTMNSTNIISMTASPSESYIRSASEWQPNASYNGNPVAISSDATNTSGNTCIDSSTNGNLNANTWKPEPSNWDNGTLFYVEAVSYAEAGAAVEEYIASAKLAKDSYTEKLESGYAQSPLWTAEDIAEAQKLVGELSDEITSIVEANTYLTAYRPAFDYLKANVNTGLFQIHNLQSNLANDYLVHTGTDASNLGKTTDASSLNSIWEISKNSEGNYILTNYMTAKEIGHQDSASNAIPMADAGSGRGYTLDVDKSSNGNYGILIGDGSGERFSYIHEGANGNVVKWEAIAINSHWVFSMIEETGSELTAALNDKVLTISSESVLRKHDTYADHHKPYIVAQTAADAEEEIAPTAITTAPAGATVIEHTNVVVSSDEAYQITLPESISEKGNYTLHIPAAYFKVGEAGLSKSLTYGFSISDDGTATGIHEIDADSAAPSVIYDLQGRRVNRASKGIYIINGKKTLVK